MSAQRKQRPDPSRSAQDSKKSAARGADDWEKMQRAAPEEGKNPRHDETQRQAQSSWNTRQDPEHPERPADGGEAEMRSRREMMRGNAGSNEQQSGDPESPDEPESGDRGRNPSGRRSES